MSGEIIFVLLIVIVALVLFVTERLRVDVVAILVLLVLAMGGLVNASEAVSGFSSAAVVTVGSIYVLSNGLYRTGVANMIGHYLLRFAVHREQVLVATIMVTAGMMSFFMNTIGIVALMLPVVMDIARRTGRAPSKLLMPLTYGALLGGLTTMFATMSNILVSMALRDAGFEPFGVFDFLPVGMVGAVAGSIYMVTVGRRMLPERDLGKESSRQLNLPSHYDLHERMFVMHLPSQSVLTGKSLADSCLGSALGLHVVAILRRGRTMLAPEPSAILQPDDRLLVQGTPDQLNELEGWRQLVLLEGDVDIANWFMDELGFAEIRVLKDSPFSGQTLPWVDFRRRFNLNVLAIRRGNVARRSHLQSWRLEPDDVLLVHGPSLSIEPLKDVNGLEYVRTLTETELAGVYQLEERLFRIEIPSDSVFVGRTLEQSRLGDALGLTVLAVGRADGQTLYIPGPATVLAGGDRLLVAGRTETLDLLRGLQDLEWEKEVASALNEFESDKVGLVEVAISPRSQLTGKTLSHLGFRERYGLTVLGLWREGKTYASKLRDIQLRFGDALLLYGPRARINQLGADENFVLLTESVQKPPNYAGAPFAAAAMLFFLVPAMMDWLPVHLAALLGALVMILSQCLTMDEAYRAVDWKAIVLIAGLIPLGTAMDETGAATFLANGVIGFLDPMGPMAVIIGIYLATTIGTCFMPTTALVLLMAPIALKAAVDLNLSPHAVMMALAMAAAGSFCSPISHPANIMIMGPGGYRFTDYLKVGIPLTAVVMIVVLLVLPIFWPLRMP